MEHLEEKFLSREDIFNGKVLHLVRDTVRLPNGEEAVREMCLHRGGVCVIALLEDGRVIMEKQFRYPHGRVFFEIPAGKLEKNDNDILEAAKRELREETGAVAKRFTYLGEMASTPALINEVIYMYLAEDISFGERELDDDEFLDIELIPLSRLCEMAMAGEIKDAKTQLAILKLARLRGV